MQVRGDEAQHEASEILSLAFPEGATPCFSTRGRTGGGAPSSVRRNFVDTSNPPPSAFQKMPPCGSSMAPSPWGNAPNCCDRAIRSEVPHSAGLGTGGPVPDTVVEWLPVSANAASGTSCTAIGTMRTSAPTVTPGSRRLAWIRPEPTAPANQRFPAPATTLIVTTRPTRSGASPCPQTPVRWLQHRLQSAGHFSIAIDRNEVGTPSNAS